MTWNPGIQRFLETVCSGNRENKNEPFFKRSAKNAEHMQKCRRGAEVQKICKKYQKYAKMQQMWKMSMHTLELHYTKIIIEDSGF